MRSNIMEPISCNSSNKSAFEIYAIEGPEKDAPSFIEKHIQRNFEIVVILKGSGFHNVNKYKYQLSENKIYCVCPGQEHQLIFMPGTKGYLISFTDDFLRNGGREMESDHNSYLVREFLQAPELAINKEALEDMQDVIVLLLKERQRYSLVRTDILRSYLKTFMIFFRNELQRAIPYCVKKTSFTLVNDFFSLLENSYKDNRLVGHYAKELFVTANYLNHLIKSRTGFSARYHIQQRILLAAKAAVWNNSSMKEIAFNLGFEDMAHFSKYFKNVSGLNFREFRRTISDQYLVA